MFRRPTNRRYNGAHGADGTDPTYLPFTLLGAENVAAGIGDISQTGYAKVAKEQILAWDPDIIFVDLGTLTAAEGGALVELWNDPAYQKLSAVKNGNVYTVNPHTSMNVNHETSLANAYYVGKVLYPEQFADIDLKYLSFLLLLLTVVVLSVSAGCVTTPDNSDNKTITITDTTGREVVIPADPQRIAVSGSGSTRLVAYLGALDRVIAVDSQDGKTTQTSDIRPYGLANPELRELPTLGSTKGQIDPERLLAVSPDLILMSTSGADLAGEADQLTEKTGIPVVLFAQYDPGTKPDEFAENLRMLGKILGKEVRAEEILEYFDTIKMDLDNRTKDIPDDGKPTLYVGGVSYSGSHGFYSTQPNYLPFRYLHANNAAAGADIGTSTVENAKIAKEQIVAWDPDILFVDLGTLTAAGGGSIVELSTDPSYNSMTAVQTGEVYAVLPHTSMGANYETILANAYYIGKVLYPEQFADIDPAEKADEIYEFVVGVPVYDQLNANVNAERKCEQPVVHKTGDPSPVMEQT